MSVFCRNVWLKTTVRPTKIFSIVIYHELPFTSRQYSVKSKDNQTAADYCLELVKKYDYENFLCTLLLPSSSRTSAFAVRAFNIEVARVQDSVSNASIGQMRLKFWEETVDKLYNDNIPNHPVAVEIYRALGQHKLSKRYFKRLITIRTSQLTSQILPTLDSMESYAENSVSPIYYLLLETAGLTNVQADHAASHLGKSQGIVNLIRSMPYNAERNRISLPQDIMLKHQVAHETVLRGKPDQPLKDAVFDVASRAKQHLDKARNLKSDVPKEAYLLFLPAIAVDSYLERLRREDFDAFHSKLQARHYFLPALLFWNKFKSRY